MHIPDGFISPKLYIPAYAVAGGLWAYGIRRMKNTLRESAIPTLAAMTSLAFILMMVAIPLPGGTSIHAAGIALLAILFGIWTCFLSVSMVLLMQAIVFGVGGITTLPLNALAMGLIGGGAASWTFSTLRSVNPKAALFVAAWVSVVIPALLLAVVLGIQPVIACAKDGSPLFFPFGISITIPALVLPHALLGIGEGVLTVFVYSLVDRLRERTRQ